MIIAKGLEIIPKRDKVTYASNISGKWEDYSIETYQGKVLKDAVERFKVLLKDGKPLDKEVPSLKEMFNKSDIKPVEVEPVDLWDMPVVHEPVVINEAAEINAIELTKVILERKKELPLQEVVIATDNMLQAANEHIGLETDLYLITAGTNKSGRQLYVSTYIDCNDWSISIVPTPMTKAKALKTIERVKKELREKNNSSKSLTRKNAPEIEFGLELYVNKYADDSSK